MKNSMMNSMMEPRFAFAFTLTMALFAMLNFSACDNDDESSPKHAQLHGWWLHEVKLEGEDAYSIAHAYWFHDDVVEGEYLLMDHKESGFSRHAVGKWYMNNIICVDNPYVVKGDTIFIGSGKDHILLLKNGKLIKNSNGYVFTKQ